MLERLCRCCVSATCLTGREDLRESSANRDLSAFDWDFGQNSAERENKTFPLFHSLLIRCHYKVHMRKCQHTCVAVCG